MPVLANQETPAEYYVYHRSDDILLLRKNVLHSEKSLFPSMLVRKKSRKYVEK